jgi:DNA-binding transcriptional ArsR family regulator
VIQRHSKRTPSEIRPLLLLYGEGDCVGALKALGEDTRMRIVSLLIEAPLGVCEIARRLDMSHYNVSKHLRILREAGLLDVEKHGRERLYVVPGRIRKNRAGHTKVLDLGCCSFQFDQRFDQRS